LQDLRSFGGVLLRRRGGSKRRKSYGEEPGQEDSHELLDGFWRLLFRGNPQLSARTGLPGSNAYGKVKTCGKLFAGSFMPCNRHVARLFGLA
jgi:hypothetical protein